jgi:glycine/D-amino acid oxidase-like deaminating enzyme
MSEQPILVVGAGVTGLCTAIFLARRGVPVEIWESAAQPGGLLAPVPVHGVPCDLGSHRVHGEALPLLRAAAPSLTWAERPRNGRLIFCDAPPGPRRPPFAPTVDSGPSRHVPYPLGLAGFLRGLGLRTSLRFLASFLRREASLAKFRRWEADRGRLDPAGAGDLDDPGFEQFVRERVGDAAYRGFYQPYVEKVWGLPADTISKTVAKKRVSTAQPLSVLRAALASGVRPGRGPGARYLYPPQGIGALIDALCREAERLGVGIVYGRRFVAGAADGSRRVVYTGHLGDLLPPESAQALEHRGLYLVYLAVPTPSLGAVDTYYSPGPGLWFGRVSLPNNFAPGLAAPGLSLLCVEIPEGTWGRERDFCQPDYLAELVRQLRRACILSPGSPAPTTAIQRFLPRVYPLYRRGWLAGFRRELARLGESGRLFPAGRQGLYLHCNIDHCVQIAQDLSQHLLGGGSARDWLARCETYLDLRVRD